MGFRDRPTGFELGGRDKPNLVSFNSGMRRILSFLLCLLSMSVGAATKSPPAGRIENFNFSSKVFKAQRYLRVWLPPQYDDPAHKDDRFPVLYLNDGQFVFHAQFVKGMRGDWHADEAAAKLIADGKVEPIIIVGIDNGGADRTREYLPIKDKYFSQTADPIGDRYPTMLFDEVMPFVTSRFRARADAEGTAVGGSSLGGLIALYAAMERPGKIGKLLLESASIYVGEGLFFERAKKMTSWPEKVYLGIGTNEEPAKPENSKLDVEDTLQMEKIIKKAGLSSDRLKVVVEEGTSHNEDAWAGRFPAALRFLFGKEKK